MMISALATTSISGPPSYGESCSYYGEFYLVTTSISGPPSNSEYLQNLVVIMMNSTYLLVSVDPLVMVSICDWIWQNPASTHKTSLGDMAILSKHCLIT